MEGKPDAASPPSQGVNILRGWLQARNDLRRKLVRTTTVSGSIALAAAIATPAVIWIFRAEREHRGRLEKSLSAAKAQLLKAQTNLAATQPKIERSRKFQALQDRSRYFVNTELSLISNAPNEVVLSSVSANVIQGKLTMRVVADAPDQDVKRRYESSASRGGNVLAAFITNVSFDRPLYPGGMRFEFVRIEEAAL